MKLFNIVLLQNNQTMSHCRAGNSRGPSAIAIWLEAQSHDSETHSLLNSSRAAKFRSNSLWRQLSCLLSWASQVLSTC